MNPNRIRITLAVPALFSLLTGCVTPSPSPPALPPSLCTTVERAPAMPEGASIVQPVTDEERTATALFLGWVAESLGIGAENADRAERAAKEGC